MSQSTTGDAAARPQAVRPRKLTLEEARAERARPSAGTFVLVMAALGIFLELARRFEPSYVAFFGLTIAGFSIHYWLPYRMKEYCWYAFSLVGTGYLVGAVGGPTAALITMILLLVVGFVIYSILASPLPYAARVLGVVAVFAGVIWWGTAGRKILSPPVGFVVVFGWAFSFRIFPYLYEVRHFRQRAGLREFVRYFFMMPAFKMATIDYQKIEPSYFRRDINVVARQGVVWIVRGMVHYAVYQVLNHHVYWIRSPLHHLSFFGFVKHLIFSYSIYLRVSGQIHLFVGSILLFGFDLPGPYRWFAFAHSPLDFWRRANVYWKDIMLKMVFMPVYFALRKQNDLMAKLTGVALVFLVTWFLHIWNDFWHFQFTRSFWREVLTTPSQLLFWGTYCVLCMGNMVFENRAERKADAVPRRRALAPVAPPANAIEAWRRYVIERIGAPVGMHPLRAAVQILALQTVVAMLFSLRYAPSIQSWLWTMMWWR